MSLNDLLIFVTLASVVIIVIGLHKIHTIWKARRLPEQDPAYADSWQVGPVIRNKNISVGVPPLDDLLGGLFTLRFPQPNELAGHVHYLTYVNGPLPKNGSILMRFRIECAEGVKLRPQENPNAFATLTLYFQRHADNWSGQEEFEHYRWYAIHAKRVPLIPGEQELILGFTGENWKSIMAATGDQMPVEFDDALDHAERVGFCLGGGGSAGHGVYATGPAKLVVHEFRVLDR